jgi:hypothetical protein
VSRRTQLTIAVVALLFFIVYQEWTPFTFTWNLDLMKAKVPTGASWLPMSPYCQRHFYLDDVHNLVKKIVWFAILFYVLNLRTGWLTCGSRGVQLLKSVALSGVLGLAIELVQFLLPERVPSTTYLFAFVLGGALGTIVYAALLARFRPRATTVCGDPVVQRA